MRILLASAMISFLLAFFDEKSKEEGLKAGEKGELVVRMWSALVWYDDVMRN